MRPVDGHPFRGFRTALGLLVAVLVYGTAGYIVIEHYPPLDAVFMAVITVTTVGYEEVHHLTPAGIVFTITLIVFGVVAFLYTFGVLVELLSNGRWQAYRRHRRMGTMLTELRDHYIVCGYGRIGKQVVAKLRAAHHPYVVIEKTPDPLADVERDQEPHIFGDAASDDVLQRAGIERAAALVSAVDSDERNVYIVLTARSLNPALFIVARSSYPDSQNKLRRAGADRVVSPYTLSGNRMAALALQPAVVDMFDMVMAGGDDEMSIEELRVPEEMATRLTAGDLRTSGAVVLAVRGADGALSVNPPDAEPLTNNQLIVAMGTPDQLRIVASALRPAIGPR